ncbi:MAG TPA: choice-of-anchor tandem repeat GloVer-containing protein [Rhizomicrobium sp.]|nr:choice-of-anchor tandem repeat GloVer-containing protein [Rhizomicrobium sp.]
MQRESRRAIDRHLLAFVSAIVAGAATAPCAQAQTLSVVHNFTGGSDGGNPVDGLMMDSKGMLFGTASSGGSAGLGVVFKARGNGSLVVLHTFNGGTDGATPNGGVIADASGALYGTTTAGGASGQGTVYRVKGSQEAVLYSFGGGTDGADPQAGLVMDPAGNLYGTTTAGGTSGNGTVFELVPPAGRKGSWTEKVLYSFGAGPDGAAPVARVTLDAAGNLYGTTSAGGAYGYGTVFQLTPGSPWTETILHSFQNLDDGATPYAGLVADAAGNLYGAATDGGANGGGTVFELAPSGGSWNFSVLASQPGWGISGTFRDLVLDGAGNIYGTTHCDGANGAGTIYALSPSGGSWTYTLLYTFTGGSDGLYSISNLVLKRGKLYGTTIDGGADGAGVIYKLTP